ncbi:MAG: DUF1667 domain-containing protein [Lentisphaerae bacterium]|jgi:CxxC motif-containing protein|nr:DUF1667 domain-containing protein [Lentisphaerota bacterium]
MKHELTCIGCPKGCRLTAILDGGVVTDVNGQDCARGVTYARQECVDPRRMVTSLIPIPGHRRPLSVKTAEAIPKGSIAACLEAIHNARVQLPVRIGDVVLSNVAGTGIDVVATADYLQ